MTITLTIDTHPYSNALIEGQVRAAVEAALQQAKLGTIIQSVPDSQADLAACAEALRKANDLTEGGSELDALECLKGF